MEEDEEVNAAEQLLSETELCVRYTESSNYRILTRSDLSGGPAEGAQDQMIWAGGKGTEMPWATWLEYAGSEERALEVLRLHNFEFELVGPGAEELLNSEDGGEEEFAIGGSAE